MCETINPLRLTKNVRKIGIDLRASRRATSAEAQTIEPTIEEWKELLSGYDLIYIANGDDYFIEHYWKTVTDAPFYNGGMYEITAGNGEIVLHCINYDL